MKRQFSEAKGHFFQIQKKRFRHGLGNMCIKFQVCIILRLFWTCNTNTDIHIYEQIYENQRDLYHVESIKNMMRLQLKKPH